MSVQCPWESKTQFSPQDGFIEYSNTLIVNCHTMCWYASWVYYFIPPHMLILYRFCSGHRSLSSLPIWWRWFRIPPVLIVSRHFTDLQIAAIVIHQLNPFCETSGPKKPAVYLGECPQLLLRHWETYSIFNRSAHDSVRGMTNELVASIANLVFLSSLGSHEWHAQTWIGLCLATRAFGRPNVKDFQMHVPEHAER